MKREPALLSEPGIVEPREPRTATLAARLAGGLAARVRRDIFSAPVRFVLWNGRTIAMGDPRADGGYYDLHIRTPATLFALLRDPANAFGDAYSRGDIEYAG